MSEVSAARRGDFVEVERREKILLLLLILITIDNNINECIFQIKYEVILS